jgi:hypothetical protein
MRWWEYRLARGAGYSVLESLASTLFNKELPSRKAEIDAEREAIAARVEKLDPELAAKIRGEHKISN